MATIASHLNFISGKLGENFYCLHGTEALSDFPLSVFVKKDIGLQPQLNAIIRRLFESGIVDFWRREFTMRTRGTRNATEEGVAPLTVEHILGAIVLLIGGLALGILCFTLERYVFLKSRDENITEVQKKVLVFIGKVIDGERHAYFFVNNPRGESHNFNLINFKRKR